MYHCKYYYTHTSAVCDNSCIWSKSLVWWTWTLHQFSKEAFNYPQLEAVGEEEGGRNDWISEHFTGSPRCHHGCRRLPQDAGDGVSSLKCRTLTAGFLCRRVTVWFPPASGDVSGFSIKYPVQLNWCVRAAPPSGQIGMLLWWDIKPAASLRRALPGRRQTDYVAPTHSQELVLRMSCWLITTYQWGLLLVDLI